MINGAHAILYSDDADATRAALAKVLGTRSVDAGDRPAGRGIEVARPVSDQGWGLRRLGSQNHPQRVLDDVGCLNHDDIPSS